jgi:excisionase family DNA binding protein
MARITRAGEPAGRAGQLTLDALDLASSVADPDVSLDDPLLKAEDIARLLSVRPSWVYDKVRSGELPCLHVGRHIRFTRRLVEHWLEGQR